MGYTLQLSVLCFHMTSFNYGAKGVRDVDHACRCHLSNIMPDSIFSVNIAWCVTCLLLFVLFYFLCVFRVIFSAVFIRTNKVLSFITITLTGLGKT